MIDVNFCLKQIPKIILQNSKPQEYVQLKGQQLLLEAYLTFGRGITPFWICFDLICYFNRIFLFILVSFITWGCWELFTSRYHTHMTITLDIRIFKILDLNIRFPSWLLVHVENSNNNIVLFSYWNNENLLRFVMIYLQPEYYIEFAFQ